MLGEQQFTHNIDSWAIFEEKACTQQSHRSSFDALEGPSYPVDLDDNRFTIPSSSSMERPVSPSESVSEESLSMHSEDSFSDDDEDWQKSDGIAQRIISMIVKIFDEQKKTSQLQNQEQNVRMASGGGGGQEQQAEQQQEGGHPEDVEEEDHDEAPAPDLINLDHSQQVQQHDLLRFLTETDQQLQVAQLPVPYAQPHQVADNQELMVAGHVQRYAVVEDEFNERNPVREIHLQEHRRENEHYIQEPVACSLQPEENRAQRPSNRYNPLHVPNRSQRAARRNQERVSANPPAPVDQAQRPTVDRNQLPDHERDKQ